MRDKLIFLNLLSDATDGNTGGEGGTSADDATKDEVDGEDEEDIDLTGEPDEDKKEDKKQTKKEDDISLEDEEDTADRSDFSTFDFLNSDEENITENPEFQERVNVWRDKGFSDEQIRTIIEQNQPPSNDEIKENLKKNLSKDEIKVYNKTRQFMVNNSSELGVTQDVMKSFMNNPEFSKMAIKLAAKLNTNTDGGIGDYTAGGAGATSGNLTFDDAKAEYTKQIKEKGKFSGSVSQEVAKNIMEKMGNQAEKDKFKKLFF